MKHCIWALSILLLIPSLAFGAVLTHPCITPVTTTDTHTGDTNWTDVTGASIGSGSFTASDDYLLIGTIQQSEDGSSVAAARLMHGSTAFAESEQYEYNFSTADWVPGAYWAVWTAVASEGVKWQHVTTNSGATVSSDQVTLCALNLSDLAATDWYSNVRTTDDSLTTTFQDGASITFTPSVTGDWLVLSWSQISSTTTNEFTSRIDQSGGATATTPAAIHGPDQTSFEYGIPLMRVYSLTGSTEYTFKEQSASITSNAHTRLHSQIFAIRLDAFAAQASQYNDGSTALSNTDWATNAATAELTPTVTSDALVCGAWVFDRTTASLGVNMRLQIEETDDPGTQTSDLKNFEAQLRSDTGADWSMWVCTMASSLAASAQTLDLDVSGEGASTGNAVYRQVVGFTMELAAAVTRRPHPPIIFQ